MSERNPKATYIAYVDEAINEKFVTSIDIKKDPAAATAKREKRPNPYKLP